MERGAACQHKMIIFVTF